MTDPHAKIRDRGLIRLVNPDYPSPALAEQLGRLGFDALFLDCEHQFASVERVHDMVRAAHYAGILALVRPEVQHHAILVRYFDAGADGLILPHTETAEDVRNAVDAAVDARGPDLEHTYLFALLESPSALANLPSIVTVKGLTGVMFGAVDLSQAMGFRGQPKHPAVQEAIEAAIPAVHGAGLIASVPKDSAAFADHRKRGGCILNVHARDLLAAASKAYLEGL